MKIIDPRTESTPKFLSSAGSLLNDPRDTVFVWLALRCLAGAAVGVALFFVPAPWLWAAPLYWVLVLGMLMDRFTLMLHCTSHRPLFNKRFRVLNHVIPWVIGPFFGQTPNTYFAHHMGMHHREENLAADLSSTMRFQRDRLDHWLRYCGRFFVIGLFELELYFFRRRQWKLFKRVLAGEVCYWSAFVALAFVKPIPTFVVLFVPLVGIRALMMMGNWAQHSFIVAATPEDPYGSSITCINTRYNRRCFNDGYHILHHVKPACHWTEHPVEFERALRDYASHDALVFDGIDYFGIWSCLMLRRWSKLADHFVALEGAPVRTREQVILLLKERVRPVPQPLAASANPLAA
jgi:fatty acid desaturase